MNPSDELLKFVSAVSGDTFLKVEENFGDGFVRLKISEAERRQAKHDIRSVEDVVVELLRNARDAHARRIFLATGREGALRAITVVDDGVGVPKGMLERVFEPRVTSKLDSMVNSLWSEPTSPRGLPSSATTQARPRSYGVRTTSSAA